MQTPVETSELVAFTRTVDARSLSRAAAELGIPRATLSRRLARLEERLGVRLLRRTTRSLTLTDAGQAFDRHARIALDAVAQAEASVRPGEGPVRGPLRVSMPPIQDPALSAVLCAFAEAHPEVTMHLDFSSKHVDLQREGYDVALRAATRLAPGLVARTLMRGRILAVASPKYLALKGAPRTRRDLRDHRLLLGFARGELPQTHWPLKGGGQIRVDGHFMSNDIDLLRDAALHGLGIAMLPEMLVRSAIETGDLVHVLPAVLEGETRFALVYPERELMPPQVRAFIDTITASFPERLIRRAAERGAAPKRG